jgi:signal peptidase I
MTSALDARVRSPWITLWLSPRLTIENIVATRPRQFVWMLAILALVAALYGQLVNVGAERLLADWRFWLGFVLVCAIAGPALLYVSASILSWISRLLGGRAPLVALRAVVAWSAVPNILGFVVALIIVAATSGRVATQGVLPLLVGAFGLWSTVVFMLMLARIQHFGFWRTIAVWALNLLLPVLLAFFVRTFLYQPFNIPAASMAPTLLVGDYIFVEKFSYGYSRYSLPLSPPLFSGRILSSDPKRGDVVVFRSPKDNATDFVKRIVGLPGDRLQMKEGQLYINGTAVSREQVADYTAPDVCGTETAVAVKRWRETLPGGSSYETLDCVDHGFYDNTNVYTVPLGRFFVLGDNRDNSMDSRAPSYMGYIPFENLVGRVQVIYFSRMMGSVPTIRTERFAMLVR